MLVSATRWLDPYGIYPAIKAKEVRKASQTLLNDADTCLRRAGYRMTQPRAPKGEVQICGNGYHSGLEHYYAWRKEQQDNYVPSIAWEDWPAPPAFLVDACYEAVRAGIETELVDSDGNQIEVEWVTSFEETVQRAQLMVHAYLSGGHYWPAEWKILDIEVGYNLPLAIEGWAEVGVIDLVVYNTVTGQTIVEDHKSAGKKWKKGKESPRATNQPAMYDHGWEAATGVKPDAISFAVMTYDGVFERRIVPITEADRALVATKERVMLPLLKQHVDNGLELPGNTSSFLCSEKWCDWWGICDFGGKTN